MTKHTIIYTSDIHGNEIQYQKLINYALKASAGSLIIGGDIAPKEFQGGKNFIKGQREFLKERLPELLQPFKKKNPQSKIYLMMGNDDAAINLNVLELNEPDLFSIIHNKRLPFNQDFDIVGYAYVPITPFGIKDWEKFDLSDVSKKLENYYRERKKTNYRLDGVKSRQGGWKPFVFEPAMEGEDSIQRDLVGEIFTRNPDRTIYAIHTPPDGSSLDLTSGEEHVGSIAVRQFIEKYQPYLTLHGHIHETVDVSGSFRYKIGKTLCFTSGNYNLGDELAVIVFDINEPEKAKRLII